MRILIIEDDVFFQKFYSAKLKEKGFEVDVAINGEEGITKAKTFHPNLIILDLIMPVKDGFEVLMEVKKEELTKEIPILVFSTLGQKQEVERALQYGAVGYVNKSFFDFNNLLAKINSYISK